MISPHALQLWERPISKCVDMLTCSSRKGRAFPTEALLLGHIINDSKPTEPGIGGALMSKHRSTWFDFYCDNMGNCQHPPLKSSQRDLTQNMNASALQDISFREQGSWDPFLWTLLLLRLWGGWSWRPLQGQLIYESKLGWVSLTQLFPLRISCLFQEHKGLSTQPYNPHKEQGFHPFLKWEIWGPRAFFVSLRCTWFLPQSPLTFDI